MVLRAYQALRASHQQARLIIAPRHLERLGEVEGLVRQAGFTPVRMSQCAESREWQIGIVDTFGQLPLYYGMATAVFIGGSLIPHGGQNPLEASSVGKPVIFDRSTDIPEYRQDAERSFGRNLSAERGVTFPPP